MSGVQEQRTSRSRRNSRTLSIGGGISPSPRVLNSGTTTAGRSATAPLQQGAGLHVEKLVEEEEEAGDVDSPVSPTTANWYRSVFASLDEAAAPKHTVPAPQAPSVKAMAV